MQRWLGRARGWLDFAPNQIALSGALRGTIATATPLVVMQMAGYPIAGLLMGIAGLQTSIADAGGPYRDRILAMGLCLVLMPVTFFAGTQLHGPWWVSALVMFVIAASAGFARALGQIGIALGLVLSIVFLVGTYIGSPPLEAAVQSALYSAGALWTLLVALLFWRLRPYKRLELEVATALSELATLMALASRRHERTLRARQLALREAIERARSALGETRTLAAGANSTMTRLLVLLRVCSRLTAITLDLRRLRARLPGGELRHALDAMLGALEGITRGFADALAHGREAPDPAPLRHHLDALGDLPAQGPQRLDRDHALSLGRQALRHLDNAAEALALLFGPEHRPAHWLLPPLAAGERRTEIRELIRLHLSLRSFYMRHALRVGVAVGLATAVYRALGVHHGFWLPLTALIILQPEFGATLQRALMRTGGTLAGVVIASAILALRPEPVLLNACVALFAFFTFLLLRRNYAMAVACITPLVILLLDLFEPGAWQLLYLRVIDTLAGAALALVCGYALWPLWERVRLPDQLANALHAEARYVRALIEAAAAGAGLSAELLVARREAEIEVGNADAAFQRMLTEPRRQRREQSRYFAMVTYLGRLSRHLAAVAGRLEVGLTSQPELYPLAGPLCATLAAAADTVTGDGAAAEPAAYESVFQQTMDALRRRQSGEPGLASLNHLFNTIISDINSLHDAAAPRGIDNVASRTP